jgi:succinyl-CoA synthetase beta subunit
MAPITHHEAEQMIEEVKGLAPLRGYRNLPKGDLEALAQALVDLSQLANASLAPSEAEINPLIVKAEGEGVTAVDGLVVFD